MKSKAPIATWAGVGIVGFLVLAPLIAMSLRLLNGEPTGGFRVRPDLSSAVYGSAVLALAVGIVSAIAGGALGAYFAILGFGRTGALLVAVALLIPEVPVAQSLRRTFDLVGFPRWELARIVLGQAWFTTALTALLVYLRLESVRIQNIVAAARLLGARAASITPLVTRLAWPAAAAGGLLASAFSLQDVVYPLFLGSAGFEVMPSRVYAAARFGVERWMLWYAIAIVTIGALVTVLLIRAEMSYERR